MMRSAILCCLLAFCLSCVAQSLPNPKEWKSLEKNILEGSRLTDIRNNLLQIKENAVAQKNDIALARSLYLIMHIDDRRTEDTVFFHNSSFIDSLISSSQSPRIRGLMYFLKGKRLMYFRNKYYDRVNRHLFVGSDHVSYGRMAPRQLDSACSSSLDKALQYAAYFKDTPVADILWLSYNPLLFSFKPGFADLVWAEKIAVFRDVDPDPLSDSTGKLFAAKREDFLATISLETKPGSGLREIFCVYHDWAESHRKEDPAAFYSIEFAARKFLYKHYVSDSASRQLFEKYVEESVSSPYSPVRASAVEQLAYLWVGKANMYNPDYAKVQYDLAAVSGFPARNFDGRYKDYYVKVGELLDRHMLLLDSFQLIKQRLVLLRNNFMKPDARWETDQDQLPHEPVLTYLKYRNIETIHVRIAKRKIPEPNKVRVSYADYRGSFIRDTVYRLQDFQDHQWHSTFIKLDGFAPGEYVAFFSGKNLESDGEPASMDFRITGMIAINNDRKLFVLDRKTGLPVKNAKVKIDGGLSRIRSNGYVFVKHEEASVKVMRGEDTLDVEMNSFPDYVPDEIYNKEDFDDLLEFFEENISVRFFTDRSIYRPGQTVHYKGILMVRHPYTGEWRVFNKKNVRANLFKSFYKEMNEGGILIYIEDPFKKVADSVRIRPDAFGSFSGIFVLPKNAATGDWDFETGYADVEYGNNSSFKVEEYKRPSFELMVQKPAGELRLGNNFSVGVKVWSFSGSKLEDVLVKYTIVASGSLPDAGRGSISRSENILSSSGRTDLNGELAIHVEDSVNLSRYLFDDSKNWQMGYYVEVEAIDNTGESHETNIRISLSTRHVILKAQIPAVVDQKSITPYYISASAEYGGQLQKRVEVKLMRSNPVGRRVERNNWPETDASVHQQGQLEAWFPDLRIDRDKNEVQEELLFKTTLTAGSDDKLKLPAELLPAGYYSIEITAFENNKIVGVLKKQLTVFDSKKKKLPTAIGNFHYLPVNVISPGKSLSWFSGNAGAGIYSIFHITYFEKHGKSVRIKNVYETIKHSAGLFEWKYKVPVNAVGNLKITQQYIVKNEFVKNEAIVYLAQETKLAPVIAVEKYRTQIKPGESEVFKVSVRTQDAGVAAQLMTTMYDASLDKIEPHNWQVNPGHAWYYPRTAWERNEVVVASGRFFSVDGWDKIDFTEKPVWWMNDTFSTKLGDFEYKRPDAAFSNVLQGVVAGVNIAGGEGLSEVVVVGYGTSKKSSITGAVSITLRGATSFSAYNKSLIVLDGVIYEGNLSTLDPNLITSAVVLRGEDATALYGSRAANGLLLLSTKGPVEIPAVKQEPPPVRKNFSETAFFYPRLKADRRGGFTISFTIPESVTEWKWKMLAHTKSGQFAYEEKSIFSQLPLMIQPDMPRFLYQGDQLVLKSRIINLDSTAKKGMVKCTIEDVVTGDDLSGRLLKTAGQPFAVNAHSNSTVSFNLVIPDTMVNPLRIRIIASGDNIADGEEHIIPVLSNRILVTQTTILSGDTVLQKPDLPEDAIPYGISAFIQPKRTASLINALPYLAGYRFNCTEQTFNKMLAHLLAIKLMRTDTSIQSSYTLSLNAPEQKVVMLDSLVEGRGESTPWLQLEFAKEKQQRELFRLLDTINAKQKISSYFDVIADNQNSDGGMSWFKGGTSSSYMSMYLLGALGKAKRDSLQLAGDNIVDEGKYATLVRRLIMYCDSLFRRDLSGDLFAQWAYVRSYWWEEYAPAAELKGKFDSMIGKSLSGTKNTATGTAGMLLSVLFRTISEGSGHYKNASEMLESIYQQAIVDGKGVRWKSLSDSDDLSFTQEEWLVKIAEAFEESGRYPAVVNGIVQWLQLAKDGNRWSTTKATGDIAALMGRLKVFEKNPSNTIKVKATALDMNVTDDLLRGGAYDFHGVYGKGFPEKLLVHTTQPGQTRGAINHYYFTATPPTGNSGVILSKTLYKLDMPSGKWVPFKEGEVIKIADKLKVVLRVETPRRLQYVYIEDKRAAAFEPVNALSGYEYRQWFSYYRSVTDEGFRFFATDIPSGISEIEYEIAAAKEGVFSNGIGSLECMYEPSVKAYTRNIVVKVTPVE
ncbi:MG2 domain-containing protein [Terrimonas sp. NA20]|uniref:MG2 domain-containing protein n=1 Tax=Terrimonas ginsenosidimutans TaxID=2908004 RepID=A0ABS9KSH8_9BACT|nr:MG2 domain-containing protein [Terrimonas ginsenosidimutans]MCG2615289.1 MG2 domain-containing protein [Terrimonas ginsenosidimutans]